MPRKFFSLISQTQTPKLPDQKWYNTEVLEKLCIFNGTQESEWGLKVI